MFNLTENHIEESFNKAEQNQSKLDSGAHLQGLSGAKGRHFLNNICNFEGCNYFEIGTYMGSTLISAAYKNNGSFVGYDNFSQFGGTPTALEHNINASNVSARYINGDYHNFDINVIPKDINIYFFDGPHSNEDQYNALLRVLPNCANKFIFIVDDWNGSEPKWGTYEALKVAPVKVLYTKIFGENVDSDHAGYWNGFGVFLLEKI